MSTADETKARMKDIFAGVCNTLGLKPLDVTLGRLCTVALPSAEQAEDLIESLKMAGEAPRLRHIDSKKDKLFIAVCFQANKPIRRINNFPRDRSPIDVIFGGDHER